VLWIFCLPTNNKTEFVDLTDVCALGCNQAVPECSSPFDGVSSCGAWSRVFGDVSCCQVAGSGSPWMALRAITLQFSFQKTYTSWHRSINSGCQVTCTTFYFFTVAINICGSSVYSMLHYTLLVLECWGRPQIFGQIVHHCIDMYKLWL